MSGELPELLMFHFSHYSERARWGLDYLGVPHRRRALLPGVHPLATIPASGQRTTPVVHGPGLVLRGSEEILVWAERHRRGPSLLPEDEPARARAWEITRWFSDDIGPHVRRAFFFAIWDDVDYLSRLFAYGRSESFRRWYKLVIRALKPIFGMDMRIDADQAAISRERTAEALAFVGKTAGPAGYLVGDTFSIADLTAAALLGPTVFPAELSIQLPRPLPARLEALLAEWRTLPGGDWVHEMFRRHRRVASGPTQPSA